MFCCASPIVIGISDLGNGDCGVGCRRIALLDRAMEHSTRNGKAVPPVGQVEFSAVIPHHEDDMSLAIEKIIDISLELDPKNFGMRTPAGFKKDMQFEMETLKEHDAPGGAGQIVRGVHMRLHAGSHIGDAVVADLRDNIQGKAITENDLERAV